MARTMPDSRSDSPAPGWHLLRTRNFALLLGGQTIAQTGDNVIKVALLWFVYALTGSALKMTMIGLVQTIPPLVLGPLIGVYLDRLPKKPVMIWADVVRVPLIALIPILHVMDLLTLEWLYILVFLAAVAATIFQPAMIATVPLIVSRSQLTPASALIQSTSTAGVLIGPAIAGPGIALVGAENTLYLGAASFLFSALLLIPIRAKDMRPRLNVMGSWRTLGREIKIGLEVVFTREPVLRALMVTSALHTFVASAFVFLLPVYATHVLLAGSTELGWMWSAYGGGMLGAALWLALAKRRPAGQRLLILFAALVAGGLSGFGLALVDRLLSTMPFLIVIGGSLSLLTPIVWGVLQELTPADLRGRVFTLFSSVAMLTAILGMLAFGWSADAFGAGLSFVAMGILLIVTGGTVLLLRRQHARYRSQSPVRLHAAS